MQVSTSLLRQRQTTIRYNWGFRFALWCAILWAFGYQGLDFLVHNQAFLGGHFAGVNPFIVGLSIAVVFTVMLTIISLFWVGANYGLRDWLRTITQLHSSNILLWASAIVGGGVALVSYIMTFLMDSGFAVAMVMFYSSIGTLIAHFWYHEKITQRGIIGLAIIALGCLFLYLSVTGASGSTLLAVLGMGIFAGLGWGIEGALAARAMDTIDSNIAMSVRFTYEAFIWIMVFIVSLVLGQGDELLAATAGLFSETPSFLMLCLAALCIHFDYLCWYKSFIYCGVSRGLAVSTISSAITVIVGIMLTSLLPSFLSVLAFVFMMAGVFLVFTGQNNRFAAMREVDLEPSSAIVLSSLRLESLPLKTRILVELAEHGRYWDYELAETLVGTRDSRRNRHLQNKVRLYLVEAQAAGLIVVLDERVDDGTSFEQGKLLCNYALSTYGCQRLQAMRLIIVEKAEAVSVESYTPLTSEIERTSTAQQAQTSEKPLPE